MWIFRKRDTDNDEALAKHYFRSGDKRYVGDLFEKHVKTVYGVCLFYFRDKDVAKDMVMQVFEKLITELRKTEVRNFKAWLSFVVRNHCINELRKNKGKYRLPETYLEFELKDATLEEEERIASVNDDLILGFMNEALPTLKQNQRICIELFYLKGLSYLLVSEKTGFSVNEVKSYIQNGKRNLKLIIGSKMNDRHDAA